MRQDGHGLIVDFFGGTRRRCTQGPTTENRHRLRGVDQTVTGEITVGTFDYRKHFPNGTRQRDFYGEDEQSVQRGK
jgi:hypothetical protein